MNKRIAAIALLAAAAAGACQSTLLTAQTAPQIPAAEPTVTGTAPTDPGVLTADNSTFFESESSGISLRIPAGCKAVASSGVGDDIGQYADPIRKWEIKLQRTTHPAPIDLLSSVDHDGKPVTGMLDKAARDLRLNLAGFIARQDVTNIADPSASADKQKNNVGMIAVRFTSGGARYLQQQALIRSNSRIYFSIVFTTPIGEGKLDTDTATPQEITSVRTFNRMLDSVRLLDSATLRREQDERLARTDILLTQWHSRARVQAAMLNEQWIRVMRNGRDVGYSYVTEQSAGGPLKPGRPDLNKGDGLLVGIRGRSILDPQLNGVAAAPNKPATSLQADVAAWWFLSEDQRQEEWSRITVTTDLDAASNSAKGPRQQQYSDFGSTNIEAHTAIDRETLPGTKIDPQQPAINRRLTRILDATSIDPTGASKPYNQPLPTRFYLPQALSTMLPRLLPLRPDAENNPRTYMFLTYVVDNRKLMSRYVEVGNEGDYVLAGEKIHAVPITDRLGWHGSITTHYVSPSGVYLGSENKDTSTVTRVTTADELQKLWKNADLRQPDAVVRPGQPVAPSQRIDTPNSTQRRSQPGDFQQGPPTPGR